MTINCTRIQIVSGIVFVNAVAAPLSCAAPSDVLWSEPRTVVSTGRIAGPPAITDVNGDDIPDLVVTSAGPTADAPGRLLVFEGAGDGTFDAHTPPIDLPFPGRALWVVCGDLNEDGHTDAAVGHHDSYDVAVYLGDGAGRFEPARELMVHPFDGESPHTHSLVLADIDGDGHLDILTTCADDNAVAVMLGDGHAAFRRAPGSPFPAGNQPYEGMQVGMLDGDGFPDIAVADLWGHAVTVLLGEGTGAFRPAPGTPVSVGDRPGYLCLGDLNHDGTTDVVVTHDDDPIIDILLGDGRGGFTPATSSPVTIPQKAWEAVVTDADGDGIDDIVLGGSRDSIIVLRGDGDGGIQREPLAIEMPHDGPGRVRAADLNRDGHPDLVVTYYDANVVDVCFGRGNGD